MNIHFAFLSFRSPLARPPVLHIIIKLCEQRINSPSTLWPSRQCPPSLSLFFFRFDCVVRSEHGQEGESNREKKTFEPSWLSFNNCLITIIHFRFYSFSLLVSVRNLFLRLWLWARVSSYSVYLLVVVCVCDFGQHCSYFRPKTVLYYRFQSLFLLHHSSPEQTPNNSTTTRSAETSQIGETGIKLSMIRFCWNQWRTKSKLGQLRAWFAITQFVFSFNPMSDFFSLSGFGYDLHASARTENTIWFRPAVISKRKIFDPLFRSCQSKCDK